MKIVIIGTTVNGILNFRRDLIKELVTKGWSVYAFALDYDVASREKVKGLGAAAVDYQFSRGGLNPISDLINTWKLARKLKAIKPDLVFSYFAKPVIFGTFAAVLARVQRRIGMLEGLGYVFTEPAEGITIKLRVIRFIQVNLYRIAFPLLDRLILLNPDDHADLVVAHRLQVARVSILGGIGLDLADYPYSSPRVCPITFVFVGRLLREKGIHEYIAAAQLIKCKHPEVQFLILGAADTVGSGGLTAEALNKYVDEGLVVYPGEVGDIANWLERSSVFVLPSYYREGVPRSTQEAMAVGRPVITTDMPGCRETVEDGVNGFLVPARSPEMLAEKMTFFIENRQMIKPMGEASHRMAQERFNAVDVNRRLMTMLGAE